jgi:GLPGLI family protein
MKLLNLLLLNISFQVFCQINTGYVIYHSTFGEDEIFNSMPKNMIEEHKIEVENEVHILEFNKNEAVYYLENDLKNKREFLQYKHKDSLYSILPKISNDFGKLIIKEVKDNKWEITGESKLIENYTCYKAVSYYEAYTFKGITKFPLIAWFCPEIPFSYGPQMYANLPGLVLEIQIRNIVYGAKVVSLNSLPKNSKLSKPEIKSYKYITLEDYNKKIEEMMSKYKP